MYFWSFQTLIINILKLQHCVYNGTKDEYKRLSSIATYDLSVLSYSIIWSTVQIASHANHVHSLAYYFVHQRDFPFRVVVCIHCNPNFLADIQFSSTDPRSTDSRVRLKSIVHHGAHYSVKHLDIGEIMLSKEGRLCNQLGTFLVPNLIESRTSFGRPKLAKNFDKQSIVTSVVVLSITKALGYLVYSSTIIEIDFPQLTRENRQELFLKEKRGFVQDFIVTDGVSLHFCVVKVTHELFMDVISSQKIGYQPYNLDSAFVSSIHKCLS
ncbi:hypothetical protein RF11_05664 [Thelohanellus kitauei]|uniref:Uncharacterized protein n=1 Tax=Thelohanellus kitauei TaxID=669202 RepID=A0A0C2JXV1_THEKT|nr:hypothetical protein RF11_05664 [Thelohanellus kitauei]